VVQGLVDLKISDADEKEFTLETLHQGDLFGQYSFLYNESLLFTAVAKTKVRLLTLSQEFFIEHKEMIKGMS